MAPERTSRRGMLAALGAIAAGAAIVLLALAQPWWHRTTGGDGMPVVSEPVTGGEVFGFARAAAVTALAGVLAIVATRRVGRIIAGSVVLVAGLVVAGPVGVVTVYAQVGEPGGAVPRVVDTFLDQVPRASGWGYATVAGAVLIVIGGVSTVLRSRWWPAMGRKYEAGGAAGPAASEVDAGDATGPVDADEAWRSLDRGDDPTR